MLTICRLEADSRYRHDANERAAQHTKAFVLEALSKELKISRVEAGAKTVQEAIQLRPASAEFMTSDKGKIWHKGKLNANKVLEWWRNVAHTTGEVCPAAHLKDILPDSELTERLKLAGMDVSAIV